MCLLSNRERALRRLLAKFGLRLHKTPARSWLRHYYGPGYDVTRNNFLVFGGIHRPFDATLEEVEAYAASLA